MKRSDWRTLLAMLTVNYCIGFAILGALYAVGATPNPVIWTVTVLAVGVIVAWNWDHVEEAQKRRRRRKP